MREDAANLFGVATNMRGVPLWSAGAAWTVSNEPFYASGWLPYLKLRGTYGRSGNISRLSTAYTTASYGTAMLTSLRQASIQNPPNEHLRWEQVRMFNVAVDLAGRGQRISGTLEYYRKTAVDLMGESPADPTLGLYKPGLGSIFFGNVASIEGDGIDAQVHVRALTGTFRWDAHAQLSYALMKITDYLMPVSDQGAAYLGANQSISPIVGKPVYVLFSYPWAGLDPQNGHPRGYLDGQASIDYAAISQRTTVDSLVYHGPAQPTCFGALRQDFSYKNWSFSVNISYKLGYALRRSSVVYSQLYSSWSGHSDYARRWQQPGDEQFTDVPSLVYPAQTQREGFYNNAEVLVIRGDHIRLEDARVSYTLGRQQWRRLPVAQLECFGYASNLGILWRKNRAGIDPYYPNGELPGRRLAFGLNVTF